MCNTTDRPNHHVMSYSSEPIKDRVQHLLLQSKRPILFSRIKHIEELLFETPFNVSFTYQLNKCTYSTLISTVRNEAMALFHAVKSQWPFRYDKNIKCYRKIIECIWGLDNGRRKEVVSFSFLRFYLSQLTFLLIKYAVFFSFPS